MWLQIDIVNQEVTSWSCTCPRGAFKCSHLACALLYIAKNIGCTDVQCEWKKVTPLCYTLFYIKYCNA